MSDMIEIEKLKEHPRNKEFFDDIYGDRWEDFKDSIVRRGVVEPIVVTPDLLIVSGHQRVRACKEMGLLEIPCRITYYPDYDEKFNRTKEDMIIEDLICTNIMQRGVGNVNPMKMAKCIQELERIKGIRKGGNGSNQYMEREDNPPLAKQEQLANEIGISQKYLQETKKLLKLIPELQTMVENGSMKATVGYKIWAKMSEEEQEKFFNDIGKEKIKTMTQKATQEYINKLNNSKEENKQLKEELEKEKNKLIEKEYIEKIVDNTDYELIDGLEIEKKSLQLKVIELQDKISRKKEDYIENPKLLNDLERAKKQLEELKQKTKDYDEIKSELADKKILVSKFTEENTNINWISTTTENKKKMQDFLNEMAKYDYLSETFNEIPFATRKEWAKSVYSIFKWSKNILETIDISNEIKTINNNILDVDFKIN